MWWIALWIGLCLAALILSFVITPHDLDDY